jgi:hypothetical protein
MGVLTLPRVQIVQHLITQVKGKDNSKDPNIILYVLSPSGSRTTLQKYQVQKTDTESEDEHDVFIP